MARRPTSPRDDRNPFDALDGRVDETLDLHGYAAVDVRALLTGFLKSAQQRHPGGLLHLITGRGKRSAGGPVLKPLVKATLAATPSGLVKEWGKDDTDGGFLVRLAGRR